MAVRVGFEPTEPFRVHFFSKEALSTTQPPNRVGFPQTFLKSEGAKIASDELASQGGFIEIVRFCENAFSRPRVSPRSLRQLLLRRRF